LQSRHAGCLLDEVVGFRSSVHRGDKVEMIWVDEPGRVFVARRAGPG
jgi:hypothetical protein